MNSTSLVDAFPFSATAATGGITDNDQKKTYGIFDCIDTDGTFIITNLLSYIKQQQQQEQQTKILWIGCGPFTSQSQNIIQALKKSNCDFGRTLLPSSLWIHSIPTDLATHVFSPTKNNSNEIKEDDEYWDSNEYLRKLIQTIQLQITKMTTSGEDEGEVVMVLDDVTALSMLVGNTNAFYFLQKLRSMNHTIIFKCSHELESQKDLPLVHNKPIQRQQMPWIAAGGGSGGRSDGSHNYWESTLVDLADEIIDVLPLPSGFSKQVHGRIIFTSRSSTNISSTMVNFYLSETQGVKIMRLRSKQN